MGKRMGWWRRKWRSRRRSLTPPSEVIIPIEICTEASIIIWSPVFPPHPVLCPCKHISIRIHYRDEVPLTSLSLLGLPWLSQI